MLFLSWKMSSTQIWKYGKHLAPLSLPASHEAVLNACLWLTPPSFPHRPPPANQTNRAKWQSELGPSEVFGLVFLGPQPDFSDALGLRAPVSFQGDSVVRPRQMAGLGFCGFPGLLALGPGSLKVGWRAKQSLATLPPSLWGGGVGSALAHTAPPLWECAGAD